MTETAGRGPNVRFPPPLYFLAGFLVGWLIDARVYHLWPLLGGTSSTIVDFLGGLVFGVGLAVSILGIVAFRRAKTSIVPIRDASALVTTGPYAITRNPMYVGLTIQYVGLCFLLQTVWPLAALPFVILSIRRSVIDPEERYLTATFGDSYRNYQSEVRRWL
jgi:protein-S-isoprenylcysteine O-methyltransferase Ste14